MINLSNCKITSKLVSKMAADTKLTCIFASMLHTITNQVFKYMFSDTRKSMESLNLYYMYDEHAKLQNYSP